MLIIALGFIVDDAMITVEMMVTQLEAGAENAKAARFAITWPAFSMLTGPLMTVAGFVPIGFAKSAAGEYTFSLFAVVALALVISWIVAVLFASLIGVTILAVFFSSRRRHTRLVSDWSSDVCSSDLDFSSHGQSGVRLVDVGLLVHAAGAQVFPDFVVHVLVPQQRAAGQLLAGQLGLLLLQVVDEVGGVGAIVGEIGRAHV